MPACLTSGASVVGVGGGTSRLIDALIERSHRDITVLDLLNNPTRLAACDPHWGRLPPASSEDGRHRARTVVPGYADPTRRARICAAESGGTTAWVGATDNCAPKLC
jgi:hypothetical protein